MSAFETAKVDVARLSDTREGGWPPPNNKSALSEIWTSAVVNPLRWLGVVEEEPIDPWEKSEGRLNVIVSAVLREKASGLSFCVSTYHM